MGRESYLGGLKDELSWEVRLFNPTSVLDATRLARIKEISLRSCSKVALGGIEPRRTMTSAARIQGPANDQKGILGKHGFKFQSKLTPVEVDEHRSKNLCFFSHERFLLGHNCPQRQKGQVFLMEIEGDTEVQGAKAVITQEEKPHVDEEQVAAVSLNSLLGNIYDVGNTMRVKGMAGTRTLHILVDTGSSHNFLSDKFNKLPSIQLKEIKPLQVTVADGGKVQGTNMVEGFSWSMQGQTFATDVILFPLAGCDLILGMQWLKTLGPITWDCLSLIMEFVCKGQKVVLTACQDLRNQLPKEDKCQLHMGELHTYCIQVVPWQESDTCYTLKLEEDAGIGEEAKAPLSEYPELTQEP